MLVKPQMNSLKTGLRKKVVAFFGKVPFFFFLLVFITKNGCICKEGGMWTLQKVYFGFLVRDKMNPHVRSTSPTPHHFVT